MKFLLILDKLTSFR